MRFKILSNIISLGFVFLGCGLFYTQIIRGGYYYNLSQHNRIRLVSQEAPRGEIFDIKGKLLADNILSYDLSLAPQELKNKQERLKAFDRLNAVFDVSVKALEEIYKKNYIAPFANVTILKNIDRQSAFKLEQMNLELPAVVVQPRPKRRYIYSEATAPILGYLGWIDKEELARLKPYGYDRQDLIGKSGIEKILDRYLRGEEGGMQIEVDNRGYEAAILSSKKPKSGLDVRLTIDADIQTYAYNLLKDKKGAIVILNPQDGRVISMVSSPSFDPNIFSAINSGGSADLGAVRDKRVVAELLMDKSAPLLNRAIQSQYPPGSIFKIVTAASGLETGKILTTTKFVCPGFYLVNGRRFSCWEEKGHGVVDLKKAFEYSCNIFFFRAAEKIQQEMLAHYSRVFCLGQHTGIDLIGEAKGFIPDKNWKRHVLRDKWYEGDTLNLSIGQGYVLMTPIQAAVTISAIANGGNIVQPYIIESIGGVKVARQRIHRMQVSPKTINIIKDGLTRAVESEGGTGILARVEGLSVAGKTGTAQVQAQPSHAWFVGYAPSKNPKASIVVFVENGGYGGEAAAPIAAAIFKKMKIEGML